MKRERKEKEMTQSLLDIDDLSRVQFLEILEVCKAEPSRVMAHKGASLLFEKPSARTRNSTEMAVVQLGGHPVTARFEEVQIDVRESAEDLAKTLSMFHEVIAARVNDHTVLERMAGAADIPVVNLLSDTAHPLQAIADVLTLADHFTDLEGRTLTWVGDYSNVARSLGMAVAYCGMSLRFACPQGYDAPGSDLELFVSMGAPGATCGESLTDLVTNSDVVATDAWYSMGQEDEKAERMPIFAPYQVNQEVMAAAGEDAVQQKIRREK